MDARTGDVATALARLAAHHDLVLPDSSIVVCAREYVRERSEPWLFNHLLRSWIFGAILARTRAIAPDPELLGIAALFHDFGLISAPAPQTRFEVVGADAARAFARNHGRSVADGETVWDAVALHTTPSLARHKAPTIACCQAGIGLDFTGMAAGEIAPRELAAVVAAFPRLEMKRNMHAALVRVARESPRTTYDNAVADFGRRCVTDYTPFSIVDALANAPFAT